MKTCVNCHESISYEWNECPVCSRDEEIYGLTERLREYHLKVDFLKMEMEKTDKILAELKAGIEGYGQKKEEEGRRRKMTKEEKSLLLFLECRAVDHGGRIDTRHMNTEDMKIAIQWDTQGFIKFGRIASENLSKLGSHWCQLSDEAWRVVGIERKARADRLWLIRLWKTTEEKHNDHH